MCVLPLVKLLVFIKHLLLLHGRYGGLRIQTQGPRTRQWLIIPPRQTEGFNKFRGKYANIKTLLTKCYLGDWCQSSLSQSLLLRGCSMETAWEKSSDHTPDAWISSTYRLARGLVTLCTLKQENHPFGLDWIKSSFSVLNWREKKKRWIYAVGIKVLWREGYLHEPWWSLLW